MSKRRTWALRASHEVVQLGEQVTRLLSARKGMQVALRKARIQARQATSATPGYSSDVLRRILDSQARLARVPFVKVGPS